MSMEKKSTDLLYRMVVGALMAPDLEHQEAPSALEELRERAQRCEVIEADFHKIEYDIAAKFFENRPDEAVAWRTMSGTAPLAEEMVEAANDGQEAIHIYPSRETVFALFAWLQKMIHGNAIRKGWWQDEEVFLPRIEAIWDKIDDAQDLGALEFEDLELLYAKAREGCRRNDGEMIALAHSELSEALEALRGGNPPSEKVDGSSLEEELADVIIRICDYAEARGSNLGKAIWDKMAFNKDRPYKHGGKEF